MPSNELEAFLATWERETENTLKLIRALPQTQDDFRPDAGGRSLGELAWHLAEGDAYMSHGIETGQFTMELKPPNIERPRTIEGLAPAFERVHKDAVARIKKLKLEDLDRSLELLRGSDGNPGHPLERHHDAQHPPPRSALADVSAGRRPGAGTLRTQSRGNGRDGGDPGVSVNLEGLQSEVSSLPRFSNTGRTWQT